MNHYTADKIAEIYKSVKSQFEDKSTEFLLEVTAERVRISGVKAECDYSDVVDALEQTGTYK